MKIFIEELQASINTRVDMLNTVEKWMPVLNNIVLPLHDKKDRMRFNATHMLNTFSEYAMWHRLITGASIVLAGIMSIGETTFKLNHPDREKYKDLNAGELLQEKVFIAYLDTKEFRDKTNDIFLINNSHTIDDAVSELNRLAVIIDEITFIGTVKQQIDAVWAMSDNEIRAKHVEQIAESAAFHKKIIVGIPSNQRFGNIMFVANEETSLLVDSILTQAPHLDLTESSWTLDSDAAFIDWFNEFRARIEMHCCMATAFEHLTRLGEDGLESKKQIEWRLGSILLAENGKTNCDKVVTAVNYLHNILNERKQFEPKSFKLLTEQELQATLCRRDDKDVYLLSLYN